MSALFDKRILSLLVVAAALVSVVTVVALAEADGDVDPVPDGSGAAQVTSVTAEAADAVSALAEARTASDEMPAEAEAQIDEHADFGMNPDLSRRSVGGTSSVYLLPASDHVCAALTNGDTTTVTCPEIDEITGGGAGPATVMLTGEAIGVFGVVPDGVESVTLAYGDGQSRTLEVTDNAYFAALAAGTPVGSVSYDGPTGTVDFPIVDPLHTEDAEPQR